MERIVFISLSVFTLGAGWIVVTNRNLFHAALAMMSAFLGVAGFYVLLEAGFLAASQLLVYIGAISILVIFAIMLTRRLMQTDESPFNSQPMLSGATAVAVFAIIAMVISRVSSIWPTDRPETDAAVLRGTVASLGRLFVDPAGLVIPFEIASVLLLAALIGAIVIAWPKEEA